jgi:hypothetical protein
MANDNSPPNSEKIANEEPNSVIKLIFDQFAITHAFKNIMYKTSWKVTNQLNDAIVLFIFLVILYYESNLLKLDLSLASITLYVLIIFIIIEFIGANNPYFKRLFFSEEKAEHFINNLKSYRTTEVDKDLSLLTFSPKTINSLLTIIETDKNKIHPYIVDDILRYNTLSTENLDRIFSFEILRSNLRRELIIDLLMKYKNQLSQKNIENIYTFFKEDENLVKILIATQIDSQSLFGIESDNSKLKEYFDKYQINEKNKTEISILIARTKTDEIFYRIASLILLWPVIWFSIVYCMFSLQIVTAVNLSAVLILSFFISGIIASGLVRHLVFRVIAYWIENAKVKFLEKL